MNLLQKRMLEQKNAEEQERLRKIQEQMELEKRLKEEEERKQREEEENRKKLVQKYSTKYTTTNCILIL